MAHATIPPASTQMPVARSAAAPSTYRTQSARYRRVARRAGDGDRLRERTLRTAEVILVVGRRAPVDDRLAHVLAEQPVGVAGVEQRLRAEVVAVELGALDVPEAPDRGLRHPARLRR